MNILKATKRTTTSTGKINKLRSDGFIPAILYGGKKENLTISLKKLHIQEIINTKTFMSKVVDLDVDGNSEKVLLEHPRANDSFSAPITSLSHHRSIDPS